MANAEYDTDNNRWRGTQSVSSGSSYLAYNGTSCPMRVTLDHSANNVDTIDIILAPGQAFAHAQGTGGTITFQGVPVHTAVNAMVGYRSDDDNGANFNTSATRLVYSPF